MRQNLYSFQAILTKVAIKFWNINKSFRLERILKNYNGKKIKELEKIIKYNFKNLHYEKALTHNFNNNINNEKLEFLGDRVLRVSNF